MVLLKKVMSFRLNNLFLKFIRSYSVQNRYFDYFRNEKDYKNSLMQLNNKEKVSVNSEFPHLLQREYVMNLSTPQLKEVMYLMANSKFDSEKYADVLKFLDEKCAVSADRWSLDLCISVLDAWFILLGPQIFRKHYYCAFSNLLSRKMKKCTKNNLILVLYFIGLSKKTPPFLMELIEHKIERFASELTDEEWAIVCLSFFKTSTKMNSDILLQHCSQSAKNLMVKNDRFNLINVLKCLRLSDYFDAVLMKMLDDYVIKEHKTFNFVECTNFLASFATQNIYSYETFNCLENQGILELSKEDNIEEFNKEIEKIHPSERSRVKDLARFLWGMAFVGHDISQKSVSFMVDSLSARLNAGEFNSNLSVLVDCVQSFILFGHYPLNLIEHVLNPLSLQQISRIEKAKPKYQIYFVSRSAYIENCTTEIYHKKFMNNIPKNLEKEIVQRNGFQDLVDYLNNNLKENVFTCCYIMPHIMISGIVVATNEKVKNSENSSVTSLLELIEKGILSRSVHNILREGKTYTCIEILDPSVCVRGSTTPLGLMKTKICHLQKLNLNVIALSPEEISILTNSKETCPKLQHIIM